MKTRGYATETAKISGTRGRTVVVEFQTYDPGYGASWWIWAGRISTWLAAIVGCIMALTILNLTN